MGEGAALFAMMRMVRALCIFQLPLIARWPRALGFLRPGAAARDRAGRHMGCARTRFDRFGHQWRDPL